MLGRAEKIEVIGYAFSAETPIPIIANFLEFITILLDESRLFEMIE